MAQNYLFRAPSSYHFRLTIPVDLRDQIGKREIRFSLKTGAVGIAKQKARLLAGNLHQLFRHLRDREHYMSKLKTEDIHQLIEDFKQQALDDDEHERISAEKKLTPKQLRENYGGLEECLGIVSKEIIFNDYEQVRPYAKEYLTSRDVSFDSESIEFKTFCREMLKAQKRIFQINIDRNAGIYTDEYASKPSSSTLPVKATSTSSGKSANLVDTVEEWFKENEAAGNWNVRSIKEYRLITHRLIDFFGNVPVESITPVKMKEFKDILIKIPKGYGRLSRFSGMSISEIVKANEVEKLEVISTTTVNKNLTTIGSFFTWSKGNGYVENNPVEGLKIKQKRRADKARDAFTTDDLSILFNSPEYIDDTFKHPYQFYLPVLALYTGCRLNELCQLNLDDIQQVDGIWCINIPYADEEDERRRAKTLSSERIIPLHPFIINDLNLIGFIEKRRAEGGTRLFPEIPYQNDSYGHYPSKWFGTFKKRCGITSGKKVFHSFRHTLTDNLKQQMVNGAIIDELTGHAIPGETMARYGKRFSVQNLYEEAVIKLDFGIDLEHLKESRFIFK